MPAAATNEADEIAETLTLLASTTRAARPKGLTQLLDLQQACYARAMSPKTAHEDVAALTRAFCLLEERIRIRRGLPLPGQLRPDLPPMKRLRGGGRRQPLIEAGRFAEAIEAGSAAPVPSPTKEQAKTPESQGEAAQATSEGK